ncbi:NETI motif-containing protein [Halalkalibacter lacteus]|uniref:NETI motif-containing protein n=1 Tax=Halalkalibacter lacteus TaxID=3090663 RepID=UPI002FC71D4F
MAKKRKERFEVQESETIEDCLDRMKAEGYQPIRRMEKPIFKEEPMNSTKEYVPIRQQIIFEGILIESER